MGIGKGKFNIKVDDGVMKDRLILLAFLAIAGLGSACSGGGSIAGTQANTAASESKTNAISSSATTPAGSAQAPNDQRVGESPASDHPVLRFEPAPEDSQIAVATKSGGELYETRIFKRHPQLVKVDSTSIGTKEKALTILLRNGEVKNVTTDSLGDLKQATTKQLLQLAGIRPGAPAMQGKTGVKEAQ